MERCPGVYMSNQERCSVYARPLVSGGITYHRCRAEHTQNVHLHIRHPATELWAQTNNTTMVKTHCKRYVFTDDSIAATNVHFDGEALINPSESEAQTQLGNPPLLFCSPPTHARLFD